MADPSDEGSESEDVTSGNPNPTYSDDSHMNEQKRTCADCGTTKTPLWRGGPAGPKSLCNACGIRSGKRRRQVLGVNKGSSDELHHSNIKKKKVSNIGSSNNHNKFGDSLKQRLLAFGREVLMQRSTVERPRKKLKEVEQAAVMLMALSHGSVYA